MLWRSQAVASRLSHQQHRLRQLQRIAARHRHECSEAKSRNYDLRKAVASTRLRLTELSAQRDTLLEEIAEVKRRIHTDSSLSRCCVEALKLVDHPLVVLTELIQHEVSVGAACDLALGCGSVLMMSLECCSFFSFFLCSGTSHPCLSYWTSSCAKSQMQMCLFALAPKPQQRRMQRTLLAVVSAPRGSDESALQRAVAPSGRCDRELARL